MSSTKIRENTAQSMITMACMDYGNTKLINAIKLGIVDTDGELLPVKGFVNELNYLLEFLLLDSMSS